MRTFFLAAAAISLTGCANLYANSAEAAPFFNGLRDPVPASDIENIH
ncbi:hypothetical protein [Rhodoblastus sp.]|jgi:hypothetical protein|nr:hypothetical protein [Rhodoblastus sp.]